MIVRALPLLLTCIALPAAAQDFGAKLTGVIDEIQIQDVAYPGPMLQIGDPLSATWVWDCSAIDQNASTSDGRYFIKAGGFEAGGAAYDMDFDTSSTGGSIVRVIPANSFTLYGEYYGAYTPSLPYLFGQVSGHLLNTGGALSALTDALPCAPNFNPAAAQLQPVIVASMAGNGATWGQQTVLAHNATLTWLYPPTAYFTGPSSFFENQTVTFNGLGSNNAASYAWSLGAPDPDILLTNATSSQAQVRVTNIPGLATKSFQLGLTVTDLEGLQDTTWTTLYASGNITRDPVLQLAFTMRRIEERCKENGTYQTCSRVLSNLQTVIKRLQRKDGCIIVTDAGDCIDIITEIESDIILEHPDLAQEITYVTDLMISAQ